MINFSKYKAILWDFDGVLMDSMPVREKGFELVLSQYPSHQVAQLKNYHQRNGGLSRYVKFRYFFEQIRGEEITEDQIMQMAGEFSTVMRQQLTNPSLLIDDSLRFVKKHYKKFPMHIVSGSDGKELNFLCKELGIAQYFQSIQGSPVPKIQLVKNVLADFSYIPDECVLIGDSFNDHEAASINRLDFIGYNNVALQAQLPYYITTFNNL